MNITIIGTGNMAKGIATRLVTGGHSVALHAQDESKGSELVSHLNTLNGSAEATVVAIGSDTSEIVILATPYAETESIAKQYNGFEGKIVVDITNPVDFNTFQLIPVAGQSGA